MTELRTDTQKWGKTSAELAALLGIDFSPSKLVLLEAEQVSRVARDLSTDSSATGRPPVAWDDPHFWLVSESAYLRSQFFAVGNAINFRYWTIRDGQTVRAEGHIDGELLAGALYMWRALRKAVEANQFPILDADFLSALTVEQFDAILADDAGYCPLKVGRSERVANLRDLGDQLARGWDGRFYNLVCASQGSLEAFARLSRSLRAYDDPLYKLTMVNAIMHEGSRVASFDSDPMPGMDYHLLRHALRQGMIQPTAALRLKLMAREILSDSEAYELRRVALQAFVELSTQSGISGAVIDNLYWVNRANCSDVPVCANPATAELCPFLSSCQQLTAFPTPLHRTRFY